MLDKTLLYFDLSGLVQRGTIPNKNFDQIDVISLSRRLSAKKHDRAGAKKLFETLIAARYLVLQYLRVDKSWDAESLLFSQLALGDKTAVCNAANSVFSKLADHTLLGYEVLHQYSIVAIDESNVALDKSLGAFASTKENHPGRPLLCCVGDALNRWMCVFSGTSCLHNQFDEAVVSNVSGTPTPRFSAMTKMESANDVI
eukprot:scaffold286418_cov43-Attheya_sp.AAC.1